MAPTIPPKLRAGATIRVIAPSRSAAIIGEAVTKPATRRLAELGLRVTFGKHVGERDGFDSSSVEARLADLHAAFADPDVAGLLTVIGGYNCNQLLPHIDWELVRANPKVLCGYSDITALQCATLARADLVTYSGPHWSTFGMERHFEPTLRAFADCLFRDDPFEIEPSAAWSDDPWYLDQDNRDLRPNEGWWVLAEGEAGGRIVGGNLCTLNLLQGTPFMPQLHGTVLFVEDDAESRPHHFDRDLTSLLQQRDAAGISGLVIGRFQKASGMTRGLLDAIVRSKPALAGLPVVANVDFGHTDPLITLPIGGTVEVLATGDAGSRIRITRH
jgi:muramoyltetrapeptide carboxypeptidase